jgi:FtsP/CotA-like multicopper oxidase with cupredoxin domain
VLIINEVLFDYRGQIEIYDTVWPEAVPRFLAVNGQREPVIRVRPGEVQRWRIIDAAHEDNFRIGLDGHELHVVAYDGIRRRTMESRKDLVIAPGQRADVLVKAGAPGVYALAALPNDQGYPSPIGPLARLIVEGEPLPMALPRIAIGDAPLAAIGDAEITNRRSIWLSTDNPENPAAANLHPEISSRRRQGRRPHPRRNSV